MGKRKIEEEEATEGSPSKAELKRLKKEKKAKKKAKKEAKRKAAEAAAAVAAEPAVEAAVESPKKAKKDKKKKKKDKKAKKAKAVTEASDEAAPAAAAAEPEAEPAAEAEAPTVDTGANNPANNPEGITRVFVGNLSWSIDEAGIREFAKPGVITDIHWTTEKATGKFLGRGFLEFENAQQVGAFLEKNGQELMGREIRIDLAQPRQNGKEFTPRKQRPLSEKPEGCTTVFVGNLSFNIEDDNVHQLCKDNGIPAPVNIRWLTDRDSGDFKGCGFIDFGATEAVDQFVKLNGTDLLGRNLRVDYAAARKNTPRAGGRGAKPLSEKPEGCTTVFLGNLSYDIEDDDIHAKAKEVGAGDVKHIRWLTDRESGEFKGCGFVEFYSTEDVDKFATLNGAEVKGRNMRVDFAKPRAPRE